MRLWRIHPEFLDRKGLLGQWNEAIIALNTVRKMIAEDNPCDPLAHPEYRAGQRIGWRNHPALDQIKAHAQPVHALCEYLRHVRSEGQRRGYNMRQSYILRLPAPALIPVTQQELDEEYRLLLSRLETRDPGWHEQVYGMSAYAHPLYALVPQSMIFSHKGLDA
jgi:hypothetical protein